MHRAKRLVHFLRAAVITPSAQIFLVWWLCGQMFGVFPKKALWIKWESVRDSQPHNKGNTQHVKITLWWLKQRKNLLVFRGVSKVTVNIPGQSQWNLYKCSNSFWFCSHIWLHFDSHMFFLCLSGYAWWLWALDVFNREIITFWLQAVPAPFVGTLSLRGDLGGQFSLLFSPPSAWSLFSPVCDSVTVVCRGGNSWACVFVCLFAFLWLYKWKRN